MRCRASTLLLALVFSMGMSLCHYTNANVHPYGGLTSVASAVINNERYLVAVGYGGVIYISTDAKNWRQIASGTRQDLYDVAWNRTNSQFVAVGANGMVLQSPTGLDWESVSLPSVYKSWHGALDLHSIAISDQEVCIVGENGLILCAKNDAGANLSSHTNVGLHFEKQESKTTATLLSITWDEQQRIFVVECNDGLTLTRDEQTQMWESNEAAPEENIPFSQSLGTCCYAMCYVDEISRLLQRCRNIVTSRTLQQPESTAIEMEPLQRAPITEEPQPSTLAACTNASTASASATAIDEQPKSDAIIAGTAPRQAGDSLLRTSSRSNARVSALCAETNAENIADTDGNLQGARSESRVLACLGQCFCRYFVQSTGNSRTWHREAARSGEFVIIAQSITSGGQEIAVGTAYTTFPEYHTRPMLDAILVRNTGETSWSAVNWGVEGRTTELGSEQN